MGKRLRKPRSMCCCVSPRSSYRNPHSIFNWYEVDVWTEIAKFLDGRSLVMLALTCKWFNRVVMEDSVWKYACLRDLQVPDPGKVAFKWIKLYATAFDGSHSYMFRQQEKHIDWMRIGAFSFESPVSFLTESLIAPLRIPMADTMEKMLQLKGCCLLKNVKTGIWIADLQLVRCPVCDLDSCDGTMQTLDARHIELFLSGGYQDGSWDYDLLGSRNTSKQAESASGAIFDIKYLKDKSTSAIFDLKSWVGKRNDWQPKAMITLHAVAVNTNLQDNEGLQIRYHVMKSGKDGEIVSIRISQQLL
ncbi:probable F-box protein at3g61730 [Phtheirospermum japonicum]|uniref:Probable F-box protein at3g61730 n=1 Tax=Phtheirospermum japonicum TaxID=374723 RepID=A0A830C445_9LAMI|nr:probable F-box protein at3g61730 [Phtheirospermum japonicum]